MKRRIVLFFIIMYLVVFVTTSFSGGKMEFLTAVTGNEFMGRLDNPSSLFFDEVKKRLYLTDSGNKRLVSFDKDMEYLSALTHKEILMPLGIVKDKEGRFFLVDGKKAGLIFIDTQSKAVKPFLIKGMPRGKERFVPGRMAIDNEGKLYIIDRLNRRIQVVDTEGNFIRMIKTSDGGFHGFNDIRVDDMGRVYAVDTIGRRVYVFDENGKMVYSFGNKDGDDGKYNLSFPVSIAVDRTGSVYVLDQHKARIFVFNNNGVFQYTISNAGVKEGEFFHPSYIFLDNEGRIYIVDGNRIQVFHKAAKSK